MQRIVDDAHNVTRLLSELDYETRRAEELYLTHRNIYWTTRNKFWILCGAAMCLGLMFACAILIVLGENEPRFSSPALLLLVVSALTLLLLVLILERGEKRVIRKFRRKHEPLYKLLERMNKAP